MFIVLRIFDLVSVESLLLCLLVSHQVSSNCVNVWNFAPVRGGLSCMWVTESVLYSVYIVRLCSQPALELMKPSGEKTKRL